MRHGSTWKLLLAMFLAFTLIAAACGDDDDDDGGTTTEDNAGDDGAADGAGDDGGSDDGASDDAGADEAGDDSASDDGGSDDGSTDSASGDDGGSGGDLVSIDADSGRLVAGPCAAGTNNADDSIGVTESSVNFAIVSIDYTTLKQLGFAPSDIKMVEVAQPFIDAVNDAGGVCGRTIDYQPVEYDILSGGGGDACLQVTEDRTNAMVFGQGGFNEAKCIAEAGTLTYSQQDFTEAEVEGSGGDAGLLFVRQISVDNTYVGTVNHFMPDLEGNKVGVWYGAVFPGQGDAVEERVFPILDDAGIDYSSFRTDFTGPNDPEGQAILQTAATDFVSNEVDVVIGFTQTTNHVGLQGEMAAQGHVPTWVWSNIGANSANELFAESFAVQDIADGERLLTYTHTLQDAAEMAASISCNEQYQELGGETYEPGSFEYMGVANMCQQVDLLVALLTLVGPEASQDALIAAFESVPNHPMGALIGGETFGSGVRFGSSQMAELTYDGGSNTYAQSSDPFDVE